MSLVKAVDRTLRSLISPAPTADDSADVHQDRATGKLSNLSVSLLTFITILLSAVLLSRQKQAWSIPIVLLLAGLVAGVASKSRRRALLIGVGLVTPFCLLGWFISLGPFH